MIAYGGVWRRMAAWGGVGPTLVARGTCLQRTASIAFCEGEIHDASRRIVARASGTFKFVNLRAQVTGNDA